MRGEGERKKRRQMLLQLLSISIEAVLLALLGQSKKFRTQHQLFVHLTNWLALATAALLAALVRT